MQQSGGPVFGPVACLCYQLIYFLFHKKTKKRAPQLKYLFAPCLFSFTSQLLLIFSKHVYNIIRYFIIRSPTTPHQHPVGFLSLDSLLFILLITVFLKKEKLQARGGKFKFNYLSKFSQSSKGVPAIMQHTYLPSGVAVFIVAAVFTALPTAAVALRIASRRINRKPLWYDDYLIIASLVRLL